MRRFYSSLRFFWASRSMRRVSCCFFCPHTALSLRELEHTHAGAFGILSCRATEANFQLLICSWWLPYKRKHNAPKPVAKKRNRFVSTRRKIISHQRTSSIIRTLRHVWKESGIIGGRIGTLCALFFWTSKIRYFVRYFVMTPGQILLSLLSKITLPSPRAVGPTYGWNSRTFLGGGGEACPDERETMAEGRSD